MGRIRKTLHWLTSPGGAPDAPGLVRYESSAEQAAHEHTDLLRQIAEATGQAAERPDVDTSELLAEVSDDLRRKHPEWWADDEGKANE